MRIVARFVVTIKGIAVPAWIEVLPNPIPPKEFADFGGVAAE